LRAERKGILTAIVRFSLLFRGIIIALASALIIYGFYTLTRAKYDVFPEFAPPLVYILTEASGLSPEQVEELVTRPIENAVNDVEGIESLRSNSIQGVSVITVKFHSGIDIYRARQVVAERLTSLTGQLPRGVGVPLMTPLRSSTSVVLMVGMTSNKRSLMDLRTIADWTVKQRLLAVPGVASVAVFGGEVKQLQIQVKPERLVKYHLSMGDVLGSASYATGIRGAGFIDNENQRIVLQTEGQSLTPDELARTVLVHRQGVNVTLGDVAKVLEAPQPPIGAGAINGTPGILLLITAQYGSNTLEVTKGLDRAMEELRPTLKKEGIVLYPSVFRPANFIDTAIHNMLSSLEIGAILVVIVLFLFLFNFRTAAISCTAIPLSLLAAITVLERLGFSLNIMILGGLAIAIGEVVDDAVIDVENIFRRLRENRRSPNPQPAIQVVLNASIEVRGAVVYATFVVVLVFIPVLTMSGVAGRLFAPLGIAYILAVLSSLIVALTVTPALCLLLLRRRELAEKEPPLVRWLKERYRKLLLTVERRPRTVIGGVIIFVAAGAVALPFLEGEFLPELREGHFIVHVSALPGTSLQESLRIGHQITLELLKIPYVRSVAQRVGRAEQVEEDIWGTYYSEINVDLKPGSNADLARAEIQKVVAQFPGINFAINTFLTERIEETISGYTASFVVNIFGNNLDLLDQKAQEIARILGRIRGATDIGVQSRGGTPQMMIKLRKNDLMRWGFEPVQVLDAIRTAYQGSIVGQVYDGNRVFDVSAVLDAKERKNVSAIGRLPIRSSSGAYIPLKQVADIYETSGRLLIMHDGGRRVQAVTCDVTGRSVSSFVAYAEKRILSTVKLPAGTYVDFAGTAEAQSQSKRDLLVHSLLAGLGIVLLLSIAIGRYRNVLLILLNLPFAMVGGLLAAIISGGVLSLGSMVGFVTVFGITLRNSIMMISHYEHLVSVEGMTWGPAAALQGASERLAPILMTALVTALGLLPLAMGSGAPGREIEGPMAIVILGGLATSTVLNLLVIPTLALRFGRFEQDNQREAAP
jgi:CzcA family heavy metal efflux pump